MTKFRNEIFDLPGFFVRSIRVSRGEEILNLEVGGGFYVKFVWIVEDF